MRLTTSSSSCLLSYPAGSYTLQVPAGEQHKASQEDRTMHNFQTHTSKHSSITKNDKKGKLQ